MFKKIMEKIKKQSKKIECDEQYIRSNLIYSNNCLDLALYDGFINTGKNINEMPLHEKEEHVRYYNLNLDTTNIIMLISFSKNYFDEISELVCNCQFKTKLLQTSYDKELDTLDEDGNKQIMITPKYYLLISGSVKDYLDLFYNTVNLSNSAIKCIMTELYGNVNKSFFQQLIDDRILSEQLFTYNNKTTAIEEIIDNDTRIISHDDADYVISKLPTGFIGSDLVDMVKIYFYYTDDNNVTIRYASSVLQLLKEIKKGNIPERVINVLSTNNIFNGIMSDSSIDNLLDLLNPVYKRKVFDNVITGGLNDEDIDEVFLQQYDRFTGVISDEDDIHYSDIDEVVSDDEI